MTCSAFICLVKLAHHLKDFHALLGNPSNKICLQAFLEAAFRCTAATTSTEIFYCIVGSHAKNLTTGKLVIEFQYFQAQADTVTFTMVTGLHKAVVLDTEDTDKMCMQHIRHVGFCV